MRGVTGGRSVVRRLALLAGLSTIAFLLVAGPASAAETPGPGWEITSTSYPTNLTPSGTGTIYVQPLNIGAKDSTGPITVTDTLPAGVTATDAGTVGGGSGRLPFEPEARINQEYWECSIAPGPEENSEVTCHNNEANMPSVSGGAGLPVGYLTKKDTVLNQYIQNPIAIVVHVGPGVAPGAVLNTMAVSGGGAPSSVEASDPIGIGSGAPGFGFARWDGWFSNRDGTLDTEAGSVPYAFYTDFDMNTVLDQVHLEVAPSGGEARNFDVTLPPGLIGNPKAVEQCTRPQLEREVCPVDAIVGDLEPINGSGLNPHRVIFNMVPPHGQAAQFGFTLEGTAVYLDPIIRTGGDYGITTRVRNAPQRLTINSLLTLWGVPDDPSHLAWHCAAVGGCVHNEEVGFRREFFGPHPPLKPFLRLPTSCGAPEPFTISASSWSDLVPQYTAPLSFEARDAEGGAARLDGCNSEPFEPTISAKPTSDVADAPTGLEFDLHIPQPEGVGVEEEEVEGEMRTVGGEPERHEADLKNAVVTLPQGIAVNPASANGLDACTPAQIGLTSAPAQTPVTMTPEPAACPSAAKIGAVTVETPLLDHPLEGGVYVAQPEQNPFGSLLAIYIAVNDEATGTVIKLPGKVEADPRTGQLTTTFPEDPQLPFEDFHLDFFKGAGAALRTPQACGSYGIGTDFTPWSSPEGADAFPADSFETTQAPGGGPCPTSAAQLPNAPSFTAGTITPKAGAYSPFVLHLARPDGSQELKKIETTLPEGLLSKLAGVSYCPEADIAKAKSREHLGGGTEEKADPSCPASSQVGTDENGAGAGPDPYYVPGTLYLAGPYKGGPVSLVDIIPGVAGPYDLGNVVVRIAVQVDELTSQVRAVSDEFPHILDGIPLDVRSVDIKIDRPNFTLNPTSCAKKTVLGSSTSVFDQAAPLSAPFQVGECKKLGFKPSLKIKLKGGTKRSDNPALTATLTYPSKGAYANIARAQVGLPHAEFLEQGHINTVCTRPQLATQTCPAKSIYGHAKVWSPLLDKPLEGPVYLGVGFGHLLPDLVAELNGQIRVLVHAKIDTDKEDGIRTTFQFIPDAPVSKFVLSMQGGKKGLLVNSENTCGKTQKATAAFTAQNGKSVRLRPTIDNGCGKSKKHKK